MLIRQWCVYREGKWITEEDFDELSVPKHADQEAKEEKGNAVQRDDLALQRQRAVNLTSDAFMAWNRERTEARKAKEAEAELKREETQKKKETKAREEKELADKIAQAQKASRQKTAKELDDSKKTKKRKKEEREEEDSKCADPDCVLWWSCWVAAGLGERKWKGCGCTTCPTWYCPNCAKKKIDGVTTIKHHETTCKLFLRQLKEKVERKELREQKKRQKEEEQAQEEEEEEEAQPTPRRKATAPRK